MAEHNQDGSLAVAPAVSSPEKSALLAWAIAVYDPSGEKKGLSLSELRKPGTSVSLQRVHAIAEALVSDGQMTRVVVNAPKGGYNLYRPGV
jgi:hypothetical protein